jgi:hypothetical protein
MPQAPETIWHETAKQTVRDAARELGYQATLERPGRDGVISAGAPTSGWMYREAQSLANCSTATSTFGHTCNDRSDTRTRASDASGCS